jgi:hypothetical protein
MPKLSLKKFALLSMAACLAMGEVVPVEGLVQTSDSHINDHSHDDADTTPEQAKRMHDFQNFVNSLPLATRQST